MAVRTQPTLSLGMSARKAKRYRATSELVKDTKDKRSDLDTKREGSEDDGPGLEDERRRRRLHLGVSNRQSRLRTQP
ncbi:hypothetical protein Tco_1459996 [Tanacetum coccineum]